MYCEAIVWNAPTTHHTNHHPTHPQQAIQEGVFVLLVHPGAVSSRDAALPEHKVRIGTMHMWVKDTHRMNAELLLMSIRCTGGQTSTHLGDSKPSASPPPLPPALPLELPLLLLPVKSTSRVWPAPICSSSTGIGL